MPKVTLPDGCLGLEFSDGTKVDGRAGAAEVTETQARDIDHSWYRRAGVMRGGVAFSFGTKAGRACRPCKRTWNAWSSTCPRCGAPTDRVGAESATLESATL
jgi:hypothetical protein